jgi:Family of unknown function (DUF6159)
LVKAAAVIVRDDKSLLVFPLMSGIAFCVVFISFTLPLAGDSGTEATVNQAADQGEQWVFAWLFFLYTTLYFVGIFFNTALVGVALVRLGGGEVRIRDGLAIAAKRVVRIFGYAVIAATVGLLLRMLEERVGWVGRMVAGALGVAWTAATLLVVPMLVTRELSPVEAVTESARLLKTTWGENLSAEIGMGIAFTLAFLLLIAVGGGGTYLLSAVAGQPVLGWLLLTACLVCGVLLALFQGALQGDFSAVLYRYATGSGDGSGFPQELLDGAFAPRSRA